MSHADSLSRNLPTACAIYTDDGPIFRSAREAQLHEDYLSALLSCFECDIVPINFPLAERLTTNAHIYTLKNGSLYLCRLINRRTQDCLVAPPELRKTILDFHHNSTAGCHMGQRKLFYKIAQRY